MGGATDIAKLLGDEALKIPAGRVVAGGAKGAAMLARDKPGLSDEQGWAEMSAHIGLDTSVPHYKALLFTNKQYAEKPGLFMEVGGTTVPLMQVGSFLRGKGLPISEEAAIAMDWVMDPINLATFGTGGTAAKLGIRGLTKAGKFGELFLTLSRSGKFRDSKVIVNRAIDALEEAGRMAGSSPELVAAAKAGDRGAIKGLLKAAQKADLPEQFAKDVKVLRQNSRELSDILGGMEKFVERNGGELSNLDLLQPSLFGRLKAGQVTPLGIGFTIPANPIKHPLTFTRQMVGLTFHGDKVWVPAAGSIALGLDKVGVNSLVRTGTEFGPEAAEVGFARDAFKARRYMPGKDIVAREAVQAARVLEVLGSTPNDRILTQLGYDQFKEKDIKDAFVAFNKKPGKKTMDFSNPETIRNYERYKETVLRRLNGQQLANDQYIMRNRAVVLDDALKRTGGVQDAVAQALENGKIDGALSASFDAQLRRLHETYGIRQLVWDKSSPGHGLAARVNLGTLMAQTATHNFRSVVRRSVKGRMAGNAVAEFMGLAVDSPGAFAMKGERMFLTATSEEIAERFPRIGDALLRSNGSKNTAHLESYLRSEGIHEEVTHLTQFMQEFFKSTGDNLYEMGVIPGMLKDYFPRVFKPNENFFKFVKKLGVFQNEQFNRQNFPKMFERMLGDEDAAEAIFKALGMESKRDTIKALKANRLSLQEARRFTDEMAVAMERGVMIDGKLVRMGEYTKDGIHLFSSYADAANRALLMNRLVRDMPQISGFLTRDHIVQQLGAKAVADITDAQIKALGMRRVMHSEQYNKLPHWAQNYFDSIRANALTTPLREDPRYMLKEAVRGTLEHDAKNRVLMDERILKLGADLEAKELKTVQKLTRDAEKALSALEAAAKGTHVKDLTEKMKAAERAFTNATKELSGVEKTRLGQIAGKATKQAREAVAQLKAAKRAIDKSFELVETAEGVARVRLGNRLSGKSEFTLGGTKFRLRDANNKPIKFQDEWAHTLEIPSEVSVSTKLVRALERGVSDDALLKKIKAEASKTTNAMRASARTLSSQAVRRLDAVKSALGKSAARLAKEEAQVERLLARKATGLTKLDAKALALARQRAKAIEDAKAPLTKLFEDLSRQVDEAKVVADASLDRAKDLVTGQTRAVISRLRGEIGDLKPVREASEMFVFRPDAAHLQDAFGLYQRSYGPNAMGSFLRRYDEWNYRVKSFLLLGDVFHFNVLAFSMLARDPARVASIIGRDAAQLFTDPREALRLGETIPLPTNSVVAGAVGGAAGAGLGALNEQEGSGLAAMTVVGALYASSITALLKNAKNAMNMTANPQFLDSLYWAGMGGWSGRPDDRAIGFINRKLLSSRNRLAREVGNRALTHPIEGALHIVDAWDQVLWETLHNGSKHAYFQTVWAKELPRLERSFPALERELGRKLTPEEMFAKRVDVARQIVQAGNNAFGGQTWRNLLDNPKWQQIERGFLLSPDWTNSRLALAAGWFMNMPQNAQPLLGAGLGAAFDYVQAGGDPENTHMIRAIALGAGGGAVMGKWAQGIQRRMLTKGDVLARESRKLASAALLGGYATANVLNYAFTGKWMWENDEEHRLQIDTGTHFIKLGKPMVEAFEFAGIADPEKFPIPFVSRAVSKLHPVPMTGLRLLMNENGFGGPLFLPEDSPIDMAYHLMDTSIDIGRPILLQGPVNFLGDVMAGEGTGVGAARAATRFAGFTVTGPKGRGAPTDASGLFQGLGGQGGGGGGIGGMLDSFLRGRSGPPPATGDTSILESSGRL